MWAWVRGKYCRYQVPKRHQWAKHYLLTNGHTNLRAVVQHWQDMPRSFRPVHQSIATAAPLSPSHQMMIPQGKKSPILPGSWQRREPWDAWRAAPKPPSLRKTPDLGNRRGVASACRRRLRKAVQAQPPGNSPSCLPEAIPPSNNGDVTRIPRRAPSHTMRLCLHPEACYCTSSRPD